MTSRNELITGAPIVIVSTLMLLNAQSKLTINFAVRVGESYKGAPIPNASVYIDGGDRKGGLQKMKTDSAGLAAVALKPGIYFVFVDTPAFAPYCATIDLEGPNDKEIRVQLNADTSNSQP